MSILPKIPATVKEIHDLCHDTKSFILSTEQPIKYSAGQFVMLNIPYKDTFVRRAYSIASKKTNDIEICLNYITDGKASHFLFNIKPNTTITIDGPYGIFKLKQTVYDKLFVCTGTGVAPLRAMIHELLKNHAKHQITLIFGERTEAELLYRKEFEALQKKHKNFKYISTLSRPHKSWTGERGYVQDIIQKYIKQPQTEAYICGIKEMVDDVHATLLQIGIQKQNISTEKYV
ncbi:MAG TPA: FAD-dependent oxidoreductase [Candidatus Nanoarchaeia archaeon]|nr:FAD-dependent oxidoreductase [Candidatus Nanoarchaeia archaeon]